MQQRHVRRRAGTAADLVADTDDNRDFVAARKGLEEAGKTRATAEQEERQAGGRGGLGRERRKGEKYVVNRGGPLRERESYCARWTRITREPRAHATHNLGQQIAG